MSVGPHQTSESGRARLVSVTNGIFSWMPLPKMEPLVTGRFTTAWSPAKPCFFSPERTTHWVVTSFSARLVRLIVVVHLTEPAA